MRRKQRSGFLSWKIWVGIAATPLAVALMAALALGLYEWRAASDLQKKIASYQQTGEPYDDASLDSWYQAGTHKEGTQAWLDVISAMQISSVAQDLPILGSDHPLPFELRSGAEWGDAENVAGFLSLMKPVRAQILEALKFPKPVYFPIEFHGVDTLLVHLQEARSISRLLMLDFEYAYYTGDTHRAMEDLDAMLGISKVFDSPGFLISELITAALRGMYTESILRSLTHNQWNEADLEKLLSDLKSPHYTPERWKNSIHGERALSGTFSSREWRAGEQMALTLFPLTPSGRLKHLNWMDEVAGLHRVPLASLKTAGRELNERIRDHMSGPSFDGSAVYMGMVFPAVESVANAFVRTENTRQWARVAVAIRLYKLRKQQWPTSLSDLHDVDLGPADVQLVEGGRYGYEVEDGTAYLWTTDFGTGNLSPQRPVEVHKDDENGKPSNLVILR
ncbi:hypothetical protein VN12_11270 [Pirellula sp. SH-Sr6A]|uniref:hypothetical protein n=1 Tax=Pirellula sp. SH-Sr6A TaxID=1632865 RepID=UPI00078B755D|nr:hypothetical protein [Pirellula sp. SH-Sr6A]AMV32695.1 hypothetical protein VN12_11270 [Pirellula sp. SH-Sr6A]